MTAGTVEPRLAAHQVTLVDLLDRLLGKGVVAAGDVTLSAADIDLVHLNLRALLASAGTIASGIVVPVGGSPTKPSHVRVAHGTSEEPSRPPARAALPPPRRRSKDELTRIDADPEKLEKGLAQLVLTLVELLRDLMERQALRRIDDGTLSEEEVDRLGETFMLLDQRMGELKDVFGLTDEDLNLDLGPLGSLL
jgi:hypothetical protein